MSSMSSLFLVIFVLLALFASTYARDRVYVCEAGDVNLLGVYVKSDEKTLDGIPVFHNEQNEMSFFRSREFWYLGDLSTWPPETHYRCVQAEGCNRGLDYPPVTSEGEWTHAPKHGKLPLPRISTLSCDSQTDEL